LSFFLSANFEPHRVPELRAAYAELDFRIAKVGRFGRNLDGFRGNSTSRTASSGTASTSGRMTGATDAKAREALWAAMCFNMSVAD